MQGNEPVVAELADGNPQPIGIPDEGDGIGVEHAQLTGPMPARASISITRR